METDLDRPFRSADEGKKSRGWMLTLPASEYTEEEIKKKLRKYCYIFQLEEGKTKDPDTGKGYLHYQCYIESNSVPAFSTLRNKFPKGHFEYRRGSVQQAYDYCSKSETRVGETVKSDDLSAFLGQSMKRSDFISLISDDGLSVADVLAAHPQAVIHASHLEKLEAYRNREKYKDSLRLGLEVHYLWGSTGVGKTRYVFEKHGFSDVYRVTDYAHPFDNYEYQPVLFLDEYRSQFSAAHLLKLLDVYPVQLNARYANKWAGFTTVYVVSNIALEEQDSILFSDLETRNALLRRFTTVTEMKQESSVQKNI